MALFVVLFIALVAILLLWKFGRLTQGALSVTGAACALGLVGYSLQGSPSLPAAPVARQPDTAPQSPIIDAKREALIGKFGAEADTLTQADAYFRIDRPDLAARVIRLALEKNPNSPALWTGLGNAMLGHGEGLLSPAAEYCYKKALGISPDYPAALYFYSTALIQNNRLDEARPVFRKFVLSLPEDSPIRRELMKVPAQSETKASEPIVK